MKKRKGNQGKRKKTLIFISGAVAALGAVAYLFFPRKEKVCPGIALWVMCKTNYSRETIRSIRSDKVALIYANNASIEMKGSDGCTYLCMSDKQIGWDRPAGPCGLTNRDLASRGLSPIVSGRKIELHHNNQDPLGPIVELPDYIHSGNDSLLHPNKQSPSLIDRQQFAKQRIEHWKDRSSKLS